MFLKKQAHDSLALWGPPLIAIEILAGKMQEILMDRTQHPTP
jgi:hypothetical protein